MAGEGLKNYRDGKLHGEQKVFVNDDLALRWNSYEVVLKQLNSRQLGGMSRPR